MEKEQLPISSWLPTTKKEAEKKGWEQLDIIIVSGDAYVDHPSFGNAVIGRILESKGYKVAIIPQPNWQDDLRDFKKFGKPRLFFGVTAGCMDSMVNHYTANKRLRSDDAYTPGGKAGFRPDYASIVYSKIIKDLYPDATIILGGVEASLRRFTHYDYWSDQLKESILKESKADMLVYGMGENAIVQIADKLNSGVAINKIIHIPQTAFIHKNPYEIIKSPIKITELAAHKDCLKNKKTFAANFKIIETESNKISESVLIQKVGDNYIVVNPPFACMSEEDIDNSFSLPYTRLPHPKYKKRGVIPAYEMIKFSVNIHRGCFGGCSFCTISAHQGKFIASRSEKSILNEIEEITKMPDFKGYISDLGGPSANMYKMNGFDKNICLKCSKPSCIFPDICNNLNADHSLLTQLYEKAEKIKGIKKIFIGSGIRYDMLIGKARTKSNTEYLNRIVKKHVSGRLKVAPEHTSDNVLKIMRKPSFKLFEEFKELFDIISKNEGFKQQLIPYFISSHPASNIEDMADIAIQTKKLGYKLEQIQDFTPTPMTLSTVVYYSGYNPYTLEEIYTAKSKNEKLEQRIFFFWYLKENQNKIKILLRKLKKEYLFNKLFK